MDSIDQLLRQAEAAHGHLCAGQILGVRMALLGLDRLSIADPRGADRKRLVTYVEIDRCATDAIALVTGCRLGKRALKFRDWGKMAATFSISAQAAPFVLSLSKIPGNWPASSTRTKRVRAGASCRPIANYQTPNSFANNPCASPSIPPICPVTPAIASFARAAARE